jgi:dihydrofolate reductase
MQQRPELVLIAALAVRDRLIGDGMELPWHIPEDLRRFKRLTSGHPILMGRRTFESLLHQMGKPLPGRRHLVLTSEPEAFMRKHAGHAAQVEAFSGADEALAAAQGAERVFIGGGASVYAELLERADRWELTLVEGEHAGDTHFPPYEHLLGERFVVTSEEAHEGDPAFRFVTAVRS